MPDEMWRNLERRAPHNAVEVDAVIEPSLRLEMERKTQETETACRNGSVQAAKSIQFEAVKGISSKYSSTCTVSWPTI